MMKPAPTHRPLIPSSRARPAGGFTLVEVLLACAVAGLLFTGAFWSLHQAVTARNELSNRSTPYVMGPAILDVIAGDLASACFYDFKENNCFYGSDAELMGREADALSFVTASQTYAPEKFAHGEERHSYTNEVGYVMRTGAPGTPFLELWRREDFFVDDRPHSGDDYVLLYDKVRSLQFQYISRNPNSTEQGVGGGRQKSDEEMLQDEWSSVKERALPRAVLVTLDIWAQDSDQAVDVAVDEGNARVYSFKRYITLPQVHMSLDSEQKIASWDGKYNEGRARGAATARPGQGVAGPGQHPGGPGQPPTGPRGGLGGRLGRGRGGQTPPGTLGGFQSLPGGNANPFLQALQGRGRPAGGGAVPNLGALFGGHR